MREKFVPDFSSQALAHPPCPFCGSGETELISLFGQQLLTLQYYCNTCHTPFERVKDNDGRDKRAAAQIDERPSSR
ncbi:MAG TPA: hypothetical protein VF458_06920 [Ktedonobacteraceae bacterium]